MSDTQQKLAIRTSSKPLATQYDIMFDRDISHANEWHEELYVMRQAVEGDLCNIHINTCGGAVSTISAFQNIKKTSEAHFHGILEGIGYSAGSAFFLLCDTYEVGDFAEMMIHTSQGSGFYTHSQGQESHGKHTGRTARKLVESVYQDFLTQEEIEELLIGKEFWFDSDQIKERLEIRQKIREDRAVEELKQTYTPEVYANNVLADLLEDCEGFGYSVSDILDLMKSSLNGEDGEDTSQGIACKGYAGPQGVEGDYVEGAKVQYIHLPGGYTITVSEGIIKIDGERWVTDATTFLMQLTVVQMKELAEYLEIDYPKRGTRSEMESLLLKHVAEIIKLS